jgi:hypothetical protein
VPHTQDTSDVVRALALGVSAHQKLELLVSLLRLLGYEDLTVFGDCFDEVGLWPNAVFPRLSLHFCQDWGRPCQGSA